MYISKEALEKSQKTWIPISLIVTEKCIVCNSQNQWLLLAIHFPDAVWLCVKCYQKHKYDPEKDFVDVNWDRVYWSRAMYKIWRGFISNQSDDENKYWETDT